MVQKRYVVTNLSDINILSVLISPAAEAGDAEAQKYLGYMYDCGLGVKKNQAKAVEWYQKGMLWPRFLRYINYSSSFFHQRLKRGALQLSIILQLCLVMDSESRKIWSRRLNCLKKVYCSEFFKTQAHSVHFFCQPLKLEMLKLNSNLECYTKMDSESRRILSKRLNGMLSRIFRNIHILIAFLFASCQSWTPSSSV
jgi:Sel1 repeat